MNTTITIRQELAQDRATVYELIRAAFATVEESDHGEQDLVERLRQSPSFIPKLSLVAEIGPGELVGHILLTRVRIIRDAASASPSLAVAPLSVAPSWQRLGVGSALIREAHRRAAALGYGSAVLLGYPEYYRRFGYQPAGPQGIRFPFEALADCCMAIELLPGGLQGVKGEVVYVMRRSESEESPAYLQHLTNQRLQASLYLTASHSYAEFAFCIFAITSY